MHDYENESTDLFDGESPSGFVFQAWMNKDTVFVTVGFVSLAIPKEEWKSFCSYINQTDFKKNEEELTAAPTINLN